MSKKGETKTIHYRDAGTGQYVPKEYAVKHPKTTVKEMTAKFIQNRNPSRETLPLKSCSEINK